MNISTCFVFVFFIFTEMDAIFQPIKKSDTYQIKLLLYKTCVTFYYYFFYAFHFENVCPFTFRRRATPLRTLHICKLTFIHDLYVYRGLKLILSFTNTLLFKISIQIDWARGKMSIRRHTFEKRHLLQSRIYFTPNFIWRAPARWGQIPIHWLCKLWIN